MNPHTLWFAIVSSFVLVLAAVPAHAQATRTWVSGVGDDANPCSRTAPCKTFAGAISKTAAGGEIDCLDPGGFGAVTITKSITIDCNGVTGGILASLTTGVIVNGAATVVVVLRNLSVQGVGNGVNGIRFLGGAALHVENVRIMGFTGFGITVEPTAAIKIHLTDTIVTGNGTATAGGGIQVKPGAGGSARVFLRRVQVDSNFIGLNIDNAGTTATTRINVSESALTGNTDNGIKASTGTSPLDVTVDRTVLANNLRGLQASGAGATTRIGNSTVTGNGAGVQAINSATLVSYKTNQIDGNGTNGTPVTGTPLN